MDQEEDNFDYHIMRAEEEIKDDIKQILPRIIELRSNRDSKIKKLQREYYIKNLDINEEDITFSIDGVKYVYITDDSLNLVIDTLESDDEALEPSQRVWSFTQNLDKILKSYRNEVEKLIDTKTCMYVLYPLYKAVYMTRIVPGCIYLTEEYFTGYKYVFLCTSKITDEVEIPFDIQSVDDVKISWGHV